MEMRSFAVKWSFWIKHGLMTKHGLTVKRNIWDKGILAIAIVILLWMR